MKKSVLLIVTLFAMGLTANAQNFALIDMEYILQRIPAFERANTQLDETTQRWANEVEALAKEARNMYTQYQTDSPSLTEAQRTQREEAIIAKEKETAELRRRYFGQEGEIVKLQDSLMRPIQDQVYTAVKEISEQNGYSMVVDRSSAASVIYASPLIDISNEVLTRLGYSI